MNATTKFSTMLVTGITADSAIEHADAVDWLAAQDPGRATAVIYDPPYAVGTPVRGREDGAAGSVFGPLSFLSRTMSLCARALRPGGIVVIFTDYKRMADMGYIASTTGLRPAACVAWVRNRPGTGGLFRASWDPILIVSRGIPDAVDRAAIRNVVVADYPAKRRHPYEKPVQVYEHILARACRPGDLVLDPFAGSGSSRDAAGKLGLEWRGCDVDPQFAETTSPATTASERSHHMTEEPAVTDEVEDFDGTIRHAGTLVATIPAEPPLPGDLIRTAWYLMDGPADRPHTVAECHVFIEQLLDAVGKLTGITNAAAIPPWEPTAADADPSGPGASNVKYRLLSALRQALGEQSFHVSNSGIGPGPAAWATLIVDGPYYVDITVRGAAPDEPVTLGGFPLPAEHDAQGWHDLAEQRAAVEGIPWPASLSERPVPPST